MLSTLSGIKSRYVEPICICVACRGYSAFSVLHMFIALPIMMPNVSKLMMPYTLCVSQPDSAFTPKASVKDIRGTCYLCQSLPFRG